MITLLERIATGLHLLAWCKPPLCVRIDYLARKDCDLSNIWVLIFKVCISQNWLPCSKGLRPKDLNNTGFTACKVRIDYLARKDCDKLYPTQTISSGYLSELITLLERIATIPFLLTMPIYHFVRIDYLARKDCDL